MGKVDGERRNLKYDFRDRFSDVCSVQEHIMRVSVLTYNSIFRIHEIDDVFTFIHSPHCKIMGHAMFDV